LYFFLDKKVPKNQAQKKLLRAHGILCFSGSAFGASVECRVSLLSLMADFPLREFSIFHYQ